MAKRPAPEIRRHHWQVERRFDDELSRLQLAPGRNPYAQVRSHDWADVRAAMGAPARDEADSVTQDRDARGFGIDARQKPKPALLSAAQVRAAAFRYGQTLRRERGHPQPYPEAQARALASIYWEAFRRRVRLTRVQPDHQAAYLAGCYEGLRADLVADRPVLLGPHHPYLDWTPEERARFSEQYHQRQDAALAHQVEPEQREPAGREPLCPGNPSRPDATSADIERWWQQEYLPRHQESAPAVPGPEPHEPQTRAQWAAAVRLGLKTPREFEAWLDQQPRPMPAPRPQPAAPADAPAPRTAHVVTAPMTARRYRIGEDGHNATVLKLAAMKLRQG
jgi:hypothetical protein